MKRIISYILTLLLSTMTLTACGMLPHEGTDSSKTNVPAPTESPDLSAQSNAQAERQARQLLAEQNYVGTINYIQDEIRNGLDERVLTKEYILAANGGLGQADTLITMGDYPKAALLLITVRDSYPRNIKLQQQIAVSLTQLTDKINLCSEELMEVGLIAYRSGEFATAINVWEQVLTFNPKHQAAQSSIQTTQVQLSNLKSMDNKN